MNHTNQPTEHQEILKQSDVQDTPNVQHQHDGQVRTSMIEPWPGVGDPS